MDIQNQKKGKTINRVLFLESIEGGKIEEIYKILNSHMNLNFC